MPNLLKLAVALCTAALAQAALAGTTVIHAGHLIAEAGKPIKSKQSILVEDGKVVAIKDGFVAADKVVNLRDSWVMPGLIDMHTHVSGELNLELPVGPQIALAYMRNPVQLALETLPRLQAVLMSGFTTIRNLGDPTETTYALRDAIENGIIPGPRLLAIEAQISLDGGDYDASQWGVRSDLERHVTNRGNCSGVENCIKVVRMEANRGADVIKLRQSSTAVRVPNTAMLESEGEVRAIIDTAHKLGRKVAAHVNGTPEYLHMVIGAGADTIEHGPLDDVAIEMMTKRGTAFTPTLLAAKLIDYRFQDASQGAAKAFKAGVPIVYGTDLGIMSTKRSHEEFALLVAAGIPPDQVLRSATMNAAAALGRADTLGSIAPGKLADIIAMKIDPLSHMDKLGDSDAVSFVMKAGQVFKGGQ